MRVRDYSAHVLQIRQTNQLNESCIIGETRIAMLRSGQSAKSCRKGCRHATAYGLGLRLAQINPLAVPTCIGSRSPGYRDGARTISLGALLADERVVVRGECAQA